VNCEGGVLWLECRFNKEVLSQCLQLEQILWQKISAVDIHEIYCPYIIIAGSLVADFKTG